MGGLTTPSIDAIPGGDDPEWLAQSLEKAMSSDFERDAVSYCFSLYILNSPLGVGETCSGTGTDVLNVTSWEWT